MKSTAKLRYLRMAPRKVRLVADLIRGKKVIEALTMLRFTPKRAAEPILKVLHSAVASAESEESNLYISKVTIDEGPKLKRYRARARGAAFPIQKKTSHITIVLDEIEKISATKQTAVKEEVKDTEVKTTPVKSSETIKRETPKFRPGQTKESMKPKKEGGLKRLFRRKAI